MNKLQSYGKFSFCFFSRNGGVSTSYFSSLNCSFNNDDKKTYVKENRRIVSSLFSNRKIILPNQIHSNIVKEIMQNEVRSFDADSIITERDDILLGILTADCAPIIILGKQKFGIVHAGWRGLLDGIIENTLKYMVSTGEKIENISVIVGPHLTKNSFEVQEDFIDNLRVKVENFKKYIFQFNSRTFFDFSKLIESEIIKLKIRKYRISNEDTFSNSDKYFSHRYCKVNKIKNCGRQISVVGIKK